LGVAARARRTKNTHRVEVRPQGEEAVGRRNGRSHTHTDTPNRCVGKSNYRRAVINFATRLAHANRHSAMMRKTHQLDCQSSTLFDVAQKIKQGPFSGRLPNKSGNSRNCPHSRHECRRKTEASKMSIVVLLMLGQTRANGGTRRNSSPHVGHVPLRGNLVMHRLCSCFRKDGGAVVKRVQTSRQGRHRGVSTDMAVVPTSGKTAVEDSPQALLKPKF
jgi:hypothetical protein